MSGLPATKLHAKWVERVVYLESQIARAEDRIKRDNRYLEQWERSLVEAKGYASKYEMQMRRQTPKEA